MHIHKFGGTSIKDAQSVRNVAKIIEDHTAGRRVIIVSAMAKSTNALEEILNLHENNDTAFDKAFEAFKNFHVEIIEALFEDRMLIEDKLNNLFEELLKTIVEYSDQPYDIKYDQIIPFGELISSFIIGFYLNSIGLPVKWIDARNLVKTNDIHREAVVNWDVSRGKIKSTCYPVLEKNEIILTQGFIGSNTQGLTTTLGREGSDYTAAIFGFCLNAKDISIWKDVEGILTADPKLFVDPEKMDRLSYREAIEMTYYGAKVIHPKTIKPLQNKSIPLFVKSFHKPKEEGTRIGDFPPLAYPPVVVVEPNQCLLHIATKDFSFIAEHHLSHIFTLFAKHRIKVNMMRNTAISFSVCTHNIPGKIKAFSADLGDQFSIEIDKNLELITVRHYVQQIIDDLCQNKLILFEERIKDTVQVVVKDVPSIKRKQGGS